MSSTRTSSLDALDPPKFAESLPAVAAQPAVAVLEKHEPAFGVAFALDVRPVEWDNEKTIARGCASAYIFHGQKLSICPAPAGHFFCVANCCYGRLSCRRRVLVPLERLPQPELDFRAQRAHLPPRLCGQHLSQIILEADCEAPILVRVISHQNPLVGWRHVGAWPAYALPRGNQK
jgi:hypothetical protein